LKVLGAGTSSPVVEVVPSKTTVPPLSLRKMGRSGKISQPQVDIRSSSTPSILGSCLQLAQVVQIGMTPEEESILTVISTDDLVEGLIEMLSRSLVVTHILGAN